MSERDPYADDLTRYVTEWRLSVFRAGVPIPKPLNFRPLREIMGEAKAELSPDDWANLTEHLTISDEPGKV